MSDLSEAGAGIEAIESEIDRLERFVRESDWDRARVLALELVEKMPRDPRPRLSLAKVLRVLGRHLEALGQLTVGLQLAPPDQREALCALAVEFAFEVGEPLQACRFLLGCRDLARFEPEDLLAITAALPTRFLNIGGGPGFCYPFWANLEGVASALNPTPFALAPDCRFPFEDGSLELVFSSHAIEHLDDPTVDRVLSEARRVVSPEGALLVKIPHFSGLVAALRRQDASFFADELWNFPAVNHTLANRGLVDTLPRRAAYLMCGFWNGAFGDLFGDFNPFREGAYHGPPVLSDEELDRILGQESPHKMARDLRDAVLRTESNYTFNHQNAWSTEEFADLIDSHGFDVLSIDGDKVAARYAQVPGIFEMHEISLYVLALPRPGLGAAEAQA